MVRPLPRCAKSSTLTEEPKRAVPSTLRELLSRARVRSARLLPMCTKSRTLVELPRRAKLRSATADLEKRGERASVARTP